MHFFQINIHYLHLSSKLFLQLTSRRFRFSNQFVFKNVSFLRLFLIDVRFMTPIMFLKKIVCLTYTLSLRSHTYLLIFNTFDCQVFCVPPADIDMVQPGLSSAGDSLPGLPPGVWFSGTFGVLGNCMATPFCESVQPRTPIYIIFHNSLHPNVYSFVCLF